jgi:GT2 family glycosyltransferase
MSGPAHDTGSAGPAVVILNWNSARDTIDCLRSLKVYAPYATTIVIDNASTDGSDIEIVGSGLASVFIRNETNVGFAAGNNVGLRRAIEMGAPSIMVLNNDTVVTPAMVDHLLKALSEGHGRAVSPRIVYDHKPETVWFAGGIFDEGWPRHLQPHELSGVARGLRGSAFLTGCCLLARREDWMRIGLFDEDFFLIFEDSDWSLRARKGGMLLLVCDDAILRHKVSGSFRQGPASMLGAYYFGRNGVLFHARWQRRYLPGFLTRHVLLPLLRSLRLRQNRRSSGFVLAGAVAAFLGSRGAASDSVTRLATWAS